jgi:hypothetical protein
MLNKSSDFHLLGILIFIAISIVASNITLNKVWGANGQTFTLFEFIAPLPAAFLGPLEGIAVVLIAKGFSIVFSSAPFDYITFLRIIPALFGAYIFSKFKENKFSIFQNCLIVLSAIFLFVIHPIGQKAWLYSMLWLIPLILNLIPSKNLFFRSLSATFTQHAVGGVIWIYFVSAANPEFWLSLIPITLLERLIFATVISFSYLFSVKILNFFNSAVFLRQFRKSAVFVPYLEKQKKKKD